ncbi:uncharacterized protein LOC133845490 [Drosophila sulfurigaster albostrigata]|uniref:uncharacterized protein LOC132798487 n=1 Tax=Drosophila nasuta TaxID=42062 RepID=UPI00295E680A|nr:uncharacterized protein LOC132798487 [Drosophila nasuta]XP_062135951.1 uncharacterized protein LOC133845490 [Drosophila sulfurigaster albostrigata]
MRSMELLNTSLTPVRFVDSHHPQSPVKQQANLANCKARLESLVKDITANYAKWQLAHQRGIALCYAIEAKKTRCLDKPDEEIGYYPDEMALACDKLALITSIFVDIVKNSHEILRQLRTLIKAAGTASNVIFYRTWKLQHFVSFMEELLNRYGRESVVKQQVMQNIAHCTQRSKLIAYTTAWEFPDHVDAYVDLVFRLLAEEVKET